MSKEQLIFEIYATLADEAMNRGYDVRLRSDCNFLEMNLWRTDPSKDYEDGYEDGYDDGCMDLIDE